jgi:DNA topoisomerase-2
MYIGTVKSVLADYFAAEKVKASDMKVEVEKVEEYNDDEEEEEDLQSVSEKSEKSEKSNNSGKSVKSKKNGDGEDECLRIVKKTGMINSGLHRIFIEALSNAIDNVWRSSTTDTKCTRIEITITDDGEITVWNDGLTIPIAVDEATGIYNPELIFGHLLTSSNYDDEEERMTSGRNGLGIKLSNIFSLEFTVKTFDLDSGKQYIQVWRNNMSEKDKPKITSPKTKKGYTQVSFKPDYIKFGVTSLSKEMRELLYKNIVDTAMIIAPHVSVLYNGEKVPVKSVKDYALLYDHTPSISISTDDSEVVLSSNSKPDASFTPVSFVNGIETFHGGVHVDAWAEELLRPVLEKINKAVKKGSTPLVMKDIRPFFRLFVNSKLVNPAFTSQEKSKLVSPNVKVDGCVLSRHITAIMKWPVIEKIRDILRGRELLVLKKTEKKKGFVKIDGLDPANLAGSKQSGECSLILCEGDSAKTFAVKGIQTGVYAKKGRDYFGIYPMKGKCLNVRNSRIDSIAKNKEISDIIHALNLKYGVDYTDDDTYNTLSYGRVIILTDSDVDGYHICGLLLNFFHKLFPTIISRNPSFITCMRTPIVRIYQSKSDLSFYTLEDFKRYQKDNPSHRGDIKYFKGLGTNNNKEIETSFGKKMIEFTKDDQTDDTMNKVFFTKCADQRKDWLEQYDPSKDTELVGKNPIQYLPISDFLNKEMIKFSIDDCKRSIPTMIDGLKESHRKILYAAVLRNLKYSGKTMKVAQLAGYVAEKTNYHHGEQCLFDTITKLAHDFVGSNNIPLLYRDGQFGSRIHGGKDAANARYIFTKMDILTRLLFRPEDDVLLTHIMDDGDKVEPVFFVPILPTILINGCTAGIGTGWSCQVPCYNPLDLVKCVKIYISSLDKNGKETKENIFPEITPWYRGFQGVIEKMTDVRYSTKGVIGKEKKKNSCVVTELPISLWTDKFKESVEELVESKDLKGYKNYSTDVVVNFELDETRDGMKCTVENLKLVTYLNTNNMVLFSDKGTIKKYDQVENILSEFCKVRYHYYELRKDYYLKDLEYQLTILQNKMRFLREVMDGSLVIQEVDEDVLAKEMISRGYYQNSKDHNSNSNDPIEETSSSLKMYGYLVNMNIRSFTRQKVETLQKEIQQLENNHKLLKKTTPADMWLKDLTEFEKEYNRVYK